MPTVPRKTDPFRILQQGMGGEFVPSFAVRAPSGPNSILESPELGRVLLKKALEKPFDPLSPNAMFGRHFQVESGQVRPSLTSGPPASVRDRAKDAVTDLLGGNRHLADRLVTGGEMVIPPVGAAFAANDFGRSVASGDVPGSLTAIIGVTPGRVYSKLGARVKPDIELPQKLPDGSIFERQTFRSDVGASKVTTIVARAPLPLSPSGRAASNTVLPEYNILFRREVPKGVELENLPQSERLRVLFTVQNNLADFVLPKLSDGKPFRVQFSAATKELEDFYAEMSPRLEKGYGIKIKRDSIETEDGPALGFILDFPAGHRLPQSKK